MSTVETKLSIDTPNLERLLEVVNFMQATLRASTSRHELQALSSELKYPEIKDEETGVAYQMQAKYRQNNHLGEGRTIIRGVFSKIWREDEVYHSEEITLDLSDSLQGPRVKRQIVLQDDSVGERVERKYFGDKKVEDSAAIALEIVENYQRLQSKL